MRLVLTNALAWILAAGARPSRARPGAGGRQHGARGQGLLALLRRLKTEMVAPRPGRSSPSRSRRASRPMTVTALPRPPGRAPNSTTALGAPSRSGPQASRTLAACAWRQVRGQDPAAAGELSLTLVYAAGRSSTSTARRWPGPISQGPVHIETPPRTTQGRLPRSEGKLLRYGFGDPTGTRTASRSASAAGRRQAAARGAAQGRQRPGRRAAPRATSEVFIRATARAAGRLLLPVVHAALQDLRLTSAAAALRCTQRRSAGGCGPGPEARSRAPTPASTPTPTSRGRR